MWFLLLITDGPAPRARSPVERQRARHHRVPGERHDDGCEDEGTRKRVSDDFENAPKPAEVHVLVVGRPYVPA
ncbi:hypothetical protein GCM10017559_02140 [Streptosporangium longisporum]|uniref:Secreted protein n=1 Tax=Streptosporangium longisporum TaxID=46187 RepID=A0ABN3XPX0_9ACTN